MLDIRLLREQPDTVVARLQSRGGGFDARAAVDEILACDARRRAAETGVQAGQAERNRLSKAIGQARAKGEDTAAAEAQVRALGERLSQLDQEATRAGEEQTALLLNLPNLPHPSVPPGADAAANPVIREWGRPPEFAFAPADHLQLGESLRLFDPERAAKISGSGFVVFTGAGARLERALINFLLDLHVNEHGYQEVSPPFLVRREVMVGTGQLPKFEADMYGLENGAAFLIPTAEVPVTNLHREEILPAATLPRKLVAYTPCFRREAGSAGRETRGLIRVHQFDKVEMVKVSAPESSYDELESMTANAEEVLRRLGLHYRVVAICTGDMGFHVTKTYDLEVWAPGQRAYLEVSSCSNCEDFQARRMNLRCKDAATGKNRFCHTLNGSGTALPRLFVALVETYQQADGSILLPPPLRPYFGGADRIARP